MKSSSSTLPWDNIELDQEIHFFVEQIVVITRMGGKNWFNGFPHENRLYAVYREAKNSQTYLKVYMANF